ncbi:Palmitoyl-protein thioesterase 1 [Tieghemiomyces parasiticus]|uniref:Serine/threonine-protein phosphatase T n=1 Tax=Tieghemiomyces parasiticus TaxID=78921 RepID=A0A9W8DN81_9FUNG|nr:Palmitoyl-protein thioesterase 1 [Tieghemiomyces parasiticus]
MTSFHAAPKGVVDINERQVITPEQVDLAEKLKNEANVFFKERKYDDAIRLYTEAIELNPSVPAYYCNRALAYINTEAFGYAIADADKALNLEPGFVKGYYRRATANMALLRLKESVRDFRMVVKRVPKDADARKKLTECEKMHRRIEFEKAIEFDEEGRSVADQIDLPSMTVDDSYDGPRLATENGHGVIDKAFVDALLTRFRDQKAIHRKYAYQIILEAKKMFTEQPSLVDITIPEEARLTVCGDVHGQLFDFLNIFDLNGYPSPTNWYLFNGDFVDRGSFSLEIILILFAYKWLYPNSVYLARGNHETNNMNKVYGFEGEVKAKFSETMFKLFAETFNALPLGHLIQEKIFVVHGGLFSRDNVSLDEIRQINRFMQPPTEGLMCEILWSDPQPLPGRRPSKRGTGIEFGPDVTENFLNHNNLDLLIRSHEVKDEGYVIEHNGKCVTVFSAPNYCDRMDNLGAYIHITHDRKVSYHTFKAVPHPNNVKPMQYASQFSQFGL